MTCVSIKGSLEGTCWHSSSSRQIYTQLPSSVHSTCPKLYLHVAEKEEKHKEIYDSTLIECWSSIGNRWLGIWGLSLFKLLIYIPIQKWLKTLREGSVMYRSCWMDVTQGLLDLKALVGLFCDSRKNERSLLFVHRMHPHAHATYMEQYDRIDPRPSLLLLWCNKKF